MSERERPDTSFHGAQTPSSLMPDVIDVDSDVSHPVIELYVLVCLPASY